MELVAESRFGVDREALSTVPSIRLTLLGGFRLTCSATILPLPLAAQRLLAFLGLRQDPVLRSHVAGALWADSPEHRSQASLRSTLWRINQNGHHLVDAAPLYVALAHGVEVDVRTMASKAYALIGGHDYSLDDQADLGGDLLPDWYDEWVVWERERLRQLRLHALEALAVRLMRAGRHGEAVEVSQTALRDEPLRESAHRVLILVHLEEGNPAEALRQYRMYERLMGSELNVEPSPLIRNLVRHLRA